MLLLIPVSLKLSDFLHRIKAKHFHYFKLPLMVAKQR